MEVLMSKKFKKLFKKCPAEIKIKFKEKLKLFVIDKYSPILNNHPLHGRFDDCSSINITGDYRAVFEEYPEYVIFIDIGNHSRLYK